MSDVGFDLLNKLLAYDPGRRISAEEGLGHEWFASFRPPRIRRLMPTYPSKAAGQTREVVERAVAEKRGTQGEEAEEGEDPLETQRRREDR